MRQGTGVWTLLPFVQLDQDDDEKYDSNESYTAADSYGDIACETFFFFFFFGSKKNLKIFQYSNKLLLFLRCFFLE